MTRPVSIGCAALIFTALSVLPAAAYGLGENFLQAIIAEILKRAAGYIPALLCAVLVFWLAKRRRRFAALSVAVIGVIGFIGFPTWSTMTYRAEHRAILAETQMPDHLDLTGRRVLYVSNNCFDECEFLRRHAGLASLHYKYVPWKARHSYAMFNAPVDLTALDGVQSVDLKIHDYIYPKKERIDLNPTDAVPYDTVIFGDANAPLGAAILPWYPEGARIRPEALQIGLAYVAVTDPQRFDLGAAKPEVFLPNHSARYYYGIYNPMMTRIADNAGRYRRERRVEQLICATSSEPEACAK